MRALRGLEMVCLCKDSNFDLSYAGASVYSDAKGEPVKDLMDMGCVSCGAAYFTRESSAIEFCPACGFFERRKFTSFQQLQEWSNGQDFRFLQRNGHEVFGAYRHEEWRMVFALNRVELETSGHFDEIHPLLGD